jgi:hypothetical protein
MIAQTFRRFRRNLLPLIFGRPQTRTYARPPLLEQLENRELLNGTPLVNAQSSTPELFVESLFESLLQRPADSAGLSYWANEIQQGLPASAVVMAIESSPEYSGQVIDQLYSTYLHRPASAADLSFWVNFLNSGGAVQQMQAEFLGSVEFSSTFQNSNAFLQALYENALSRPLDNTGLQAWNQALAAGASRTQVALNILNSDEAQQLFVQGLYARFLGRTGNAEEIGTWIQALGNGENRQQVFAQIAGSSESIAYQAAGIENELASGVWTSASVAPQSLLIEFQAGTTAASVLDALAWVDGAVAPGSPTAAGNTPTSIAVNIPERRTLANAAQLLQQHLNVVAVGADLTSVDDLTSALSWLQARSTAMIQASSVTMSNGDTAFLPQVGTNYDAFWLRDFAYMVEGNPGAFTNQQLLQDGQLFIDSLRWDGAGVDSIGLDGTPYYEPDAGQLGANPVADGSPFTIDVAWRVYQQTQNVSFVANNLVALEKCIAAVPLDPANGLVYDDGTRSSYGFTDQVPKLGDDLFCSLLLIRAYREMADLFTAVGASDVAATWQASANHLVSDVQSVFWDPQTGLFLAATVQGNQPDIWGSAFAVYLGVTTPAQSLAIATYFQNNYSGIVYDGQLRELPAEMYWQNMPGPRDQYQNGGYWATPIGWFVYTLDEVNPHLADQTVMDMVQDFYVNGVHEDVFGSQGWGPNYNSSVTLPLAGIEAMLQRDQGGGGG